jgi:hypothetical protein
VAAELFAAGLRPSQVARRLRVTRSRVPVASGLDGQQEERAGLQGGGARCTAPPNTTRR